MVKKVFSDPPHLKYADSCQLQNKFLFVGREFKEINGQKGRRRTFQVEGSNERMA